MSASTRTFRARSRARAHDLPRALALLAVLAGGGAAAQDAERWQAVGDSPTGIGTPGPSDEALIGTRDAREPEGSAASDETARAADAGEATDTAAAAEEPRGPEAGSERDAEPAVDERPLRARSLVRELGSGRNARPVVPADADVADVVAPDDDASPSSRSVPRTIAELRPGDVDMFVGEVKTLGQVALERVAIGNGAVVRADILDSGELLVIAEGVGSTSLRLWHEDGRQSDYNIRVSETDPVTRVRMERMVRMRVRLVEFRKSALRNLGIDWSDDVAGPGLAAAGDVVGSNLVRPPSPDFPALPNRVAPFSTYFGIATNISSRINLLAQNGDAVMLAEPVLSAVNGGSASFLAGGEVPYPSRGEDGQTVVEFKEYGIKLDIAPSIDAAGNVRTLVQTESSQIDPAVSVAGAPGLLTRRAQTEVNVRSGETIVISGLLNVDSSTDIDSLPGLGRLPILGKLFRSENVRKAVSELVIFVTPEVSEPGEQVLLAREEEVLEKSGARLGEARAELPLME